MANRITEQFHEQTSRFATDVEGIIREVSDELGFTPEDELFRGQIYQADKLSTVILRGRTASDSPAVLKVQGLPHETEEPEILQKFTAQNRSRVVRVPTVLAYSPWDETRGFSYWLMEDVRGERIMGDAPASPKERAEWLRFYAEYRGSCLGEAFLLEPNLSAPSGRFNVARARKWLGIARTQQILTPEKEARVARFLEIQAGNELPLEWMHGHLGSDDVLRTPDGGFVIFSNVLWGARPPLYDAVWQVWMRMKSPKVPPRTPPEALAEIETWREAYRAAVPEFAANEGFDRAWDFAVLERAIGTTLLDIDNQNYDGRGGGARWEELRTLWAGIFDEFVARVAG